MIELFLKISLLVWPFGQLLVFRGNSIKIYLLDIFIGLLSLSLLITQKSRKKIKDDLLTKPLLYFFIIAAISLSLNIHQLTEWSQKGMSILYLIRLISYSSIYYALKQIKIENLKSTISASIILFIFFSLIQYLFIPNLSQLKFIGFDDHYYRLAGTLFDPNFTGLILTIFSIIALQINNLFIAIFTLVLLGLTFSRASYITYVIGIIATKKLLNLKIILALLGIIILVIYFSPKPFGEGVNLLRTFSVTSRLNSTKIGLEMFLQKPILGWGYNTLSAVRPNPISVDNSFVFILATTGILGFAIFTKLVYVLLQNLNQTGKLILLLVGIHSLFNNSLFYIWIYFLFWFAIGYYQNKIKEGI